MYKHTLTHLCGWCHAVVSARNALCILKHLATEWAARVFTQKMKPEIFLNGIVYEYCCVIVYPKVTHICHTHVVYVAIVNVLVTLL